jgi:serine phosphatase RsbU (regulator of sigma subunit)
MPGMPVLAERARARPGAVWTPSVSDCPGIARLAGDFYEALTVRDGVLLAIGDVQGHSLRAAIVMGELRHALRAFAEEGHSPGTISRLIGGVLRRYHPDILATICLAFIDPASGELEIVNCGHIPPLLIGDSGASYRGQGGLLLGMPVHDAHSERAALPPGGTLLLVTDGLIEERHVLLDANLDRLRVTAESKRDADVNTFADHLLSEFGPREDDVVLIVLRRA